MARFIRCEGGYVEVSGDRAAAAAWYRRHLGLSLVGDGPEQTLLGFVGGNMLPLVRTPPGARRSREGTLRLCFESPDLRATHQAMLADGVRVTPVVTGVGGADTFDFYDLEGTRLSAVAAPEWLVEYPQDRFVRYAPPRIGVRDVGRAAGWYERHLGTRLLEHYPAEGHALVVLGERTPVWLEALPEEQFGRDTDLHARPFFGTLDIVEAHRYCLSHGLRPSEITGPPVTPVSVFDFHDPDGNQISVWHYGGIEATWERYSTQDLPFRYRDRQGVAATFHVTPRPAITLV